MKLKLIVIFLIFYGVILQESSFAQNNDRWHPPPFPEFNRENVFIDPVLFYDNDSIDARLDLYIEIPIPAVIFKRNLTKGIYESSIEMTLNIEDLKNINSIDKVFNKYSSFTDEEMKNESKGSLYFLKVFFVKKGDYKLNFKIKDLNSNNEYIKSDSLSVKEKSSIFFSDIILLTDYKINSEGEKEITPLISKNIFNLSELYIFFEIYNHSDSAVNKEYAYRIKDDNDKIISEGSFYYYLSNRTNKEIEKISFLNSQNGIFTFEIIDKSNQEIVVTKRFVNIPHLMHKGRMQEDMHKPRNLRL